MAHSELEAAGAALAARVRAMKCLVLLIPAGRIPLIIFHWCRESHIHILSHQVHERSSSCFRFLIQSCSGEEESSVEERGWFSVLAESEETGRLRPWESSGDREKGLGSV